MFNAQKPDPSELPTTVRLLKSTGIAGTVAAALLVVAVLPAEYGIDPTGAGSLLGLTEMGRIKMQLAEEAKAEALASEQAAPADVQAALSATSPVVSAPDQLAAVTAQPPVSAPLAAAVAAPHTKSAPAAPEQPAWSDSMTIKLAPDEGYEVKLVMAKGATARFEWFTNGPKVNYDTHGDGAGVKYHGYEKGTNVDSKAGELTAAFAGNHGWFWRNRSGEPVMITLNTAGAYSEIKEFE